MKLLMYSSRPDEQKWIKEWQERHPGVEIDTNEEVLTAQTVGLAKGYDGISVTQSVSMVDDEIYEKLNAYGIKAMGTRTVGYDIIDVKEARNKGITVTNVPSYSPRAIAELAFSQALYFMRNLHKYNAAFGRQDFRWHGWISPEIHTLKVGVVGTGKIGATAAKLFHSVGATILGYDMYQNPELTGFIEYQDTLEELLEKSDIITLHTPLTAENGHMLNERTLSLMKDGAILVNTARGGLIDTKALLAALKSGKIGAVALDSIEDETDYFKHDFTGREIENQIYKEFLEMENVMMTPHIAFFTHNAVDNIVNKGLDGVYEILTEGKSQYSVN